MILTMQNLDRLITKNSVTHESDLEKQRFSASFRGGEDEEITNVDISVEGEDICFTSYLKKDLTGDDLNKAAEFVTRANQNFSMGSLQLDYDTGSVYFRVLCHLEEGQELSAEELATYLFLGPMTAQLYGKNGLDAMLEKDLSPKDALDELSKMEAKPAMSFVLPDPPAGIKLPVKKRPEIGRKEATPDPFEDDEDFEDRYEGFDDFDHGPLTDSIRDYYDSQEWKYDYDPVNNVFRMNFQSKCVDSYRIITFIREEERFTTLTVFPIKIPEDKRNLAVEFIARANYGMILGCFEMDPQDGQLQFKDTCLCGDIQLEEDVVENHIDIGFRMCDRYGPGLMEVLYGDVSPKDAIDKIESDIRGNNSPSGASAAPAEETAPAPEVPQKPKKKGLRGFLSSLFGDGDTGSQDQN